MKRKPGRFDKPPASPFAKWVKSQGLQSTMTEIRSPAHLARILYVKGVLNKAGLIEWCKDVIETHENAIAAIIAGTRAPGDDIQTRLNELEEIREALDEVNGLPDDEPRTI